MKRFTLLIVLIVFLFSVSAVENSTNQNINETTKNDLSKKSFTGYPALDIILISCLITLISSLITKYTTPQDEIRKLRKDMKKLQKKMKEHMKKQEMEEVKSIQKEIMAINGELFRKNMNLKQMLVTSLPLILIFSFIKNNYSVYGEFLNLGFTRFGWLGTYIWSSIIFSTIWRKILKIA